MQRLLTVAAATALTAFVGAQTNIVVPAPAATVAGDTSNAFPWGTTAASWQGLRLQATYGAVNFTSQNITGPVVITELKWRPDDNAAAVTGGTFTLATVQMSTSPVGWNGVTGNYAGNHGANVQTVYAGPVVHTATPGPGAWTPQSWCVDIVLTNPFLYDPSGGDLVIDCDYLAGSFVGGTVGQMDVQSAGSNASRVFASSLYPAANGITTSHGPVVEVTCAPAVGFANKAKYGTGCVQLPDQSFYESFPAGTHDLSGTSMSLLNSGAGYVVIGNIANLYPTTAAAPLPLGDNTAVTVPLATGWIPYGIGGQATSLYVCANGFVAVGNNGTSASPSASGLLGAPHAGWWCQHDYNPLIAGSGQVKHEETTTHVYVTWDNVFSFGSTGPGSTFQFQLEKYTGNVHVVWGTIDNMGNGHIVGFSEGGASVDPGNMDLSAALATGFTVAFGVQPISLDASARPVLGATIQLVADHVPTGSPLGAMLLGLTELNPGVSLAGIGMPGCFQYTSAEAIRLFLPTGATASVPIALSANPAFAGVQIKGQAVALSPAVNQAGAVSSNGLRLTLDVH